jgi:hypothetical protein
LKADLHSFYQTHLLSIINRIIYLRLSDDEDTPYQCAHFLSTGLTLGQFNNLRSLIFNCVSSDLKITHLFFSELYRLHHLTHLKFVNCQLYHVDENDFQGIIDQIWNLPKLTHLYWEVDFTGTTYFCIPTFVSTSLQYLTTRKNYWSSKNFPKLLEKTPHLRKFSTSLNSYEDDDIPPSEQFIPSFKNLSVRKLFLFDIRSQRVTTNLLQLLPNVNHLKIHIPYLNLDGHDWEQMIINYLPQLKVFQLMMDSQLCLSVDEQNNEEKIDEYLATYRTPFWIQHHQWFIRCHWSVWREKDLSICLYSLPYAFDYFPIASNELDSNIKSTCPPEMHFSYDSIRNVGYNLTYLNDNTWSHIQLINIERLTIPLPMDYRFLSIITRFQNLCSLNVKIPTRNYESQLQALLDNAPRLYSLSFESWDTSEMPPYEYTSKSIRRLDLCGYNQLRRRICYDNKQCIKLSGSPLGIQCRVLNIEVKRVESIVILIYSMINLRTLHVSYEYDSRSNVYDNVELLQCVLPSRWNITRPYYGRFIIQS